MQHQGDLKVSTEIWRLKHDTIYHGIIQLGIEIKNQFTTNLVDTRHLFTKCNSILSGEIQKLKISSDCSLKYCIQSH